MWSLGLRVRIPKYQGNESHWRPGNIVVIDEIPISYPYFNARRSRNPRKLAGTRGRRSLVLHEKSGSVRCIPRSWSQSHSSATLPPSMALEELGSTTKGDELFAFYTLGSTHLKLEVLAPTVCARNTLGPVL